MIPTTAATISLMVFAFFSFAHLVVEAIHSRRGRYLTKPILMPLLSLYYVSSTGQPNPFLLAALTCGWLGDVFLMIPESQKTRNYFTAGVLSFILGHIFYVFVFAEYLPWIGNVPEWGWGILAAYLAAGLCGYLFIIRYARKMSPVIRVYIIVIVLMGASTILPLGTVSTAGAVMAMAGAFGFMLSDIVNACNRFVKKVPLEWLFVMGFYLVGQFLLVQGYLLY